jgi:type I site-specific restriction-modification system R (restriction) subunit
MPEYNTIGVVNASERIQLLIDEAHRSQSGDLGDNLFEAFPNATRLGINPMIPPVELMSPRFIQEINKHTSTKAKASEMEHAIRKHCKIHFDEDPALYAKMSEKLEALLQKHKENWEQLCHSLFPLW